MPGIFKGFVELMIRAECFVEAVKKIGFGLWTGVPCSYLKPFINYVIDDPEQRYVAAANEGDAVAIAAGAQLGGLRAIVMFQNSGLGNAVNPLTSLTYTFKIPVLLIVTLRGEPGGATRRTATQTDGGDYREDAGSDGDSLGVFSRRGGRSGKSAGARGFSYGS